MGPEPDANIFDLAEELSDVCIYGGLAQNHSWRWEGRDVLADEGSVVLERVVHCGWRSTQGSEGQGITESVSDGAYRHGL